MKKYLLFVCLFLEIAVLFNSCEKAPFVTLIGSRSYNFTREGGTQSFAFSCNRDWSISSTESWIRISPSLGKANEEEVSVTINCLPNTTFDSRTATITLKVEELMETITVSQDTGIGLLVSPTTFDLTNAAQTIEIEIQKNVQYSVVIDDESAKWIKQSSTKALTTDKVNFTIAANESYDNREGKITFKQSNGDLSQTITVRQSQTNGLFITTPDYNLSNEAHTLSVEVKANVEFEVTSQTGWIKYVGTKALTPSTITLSVEANETYDDRTGTVLVKQKNGDLTGTITVNQKQTDYMSVSPTSFTLTNAEQSVDIEVKDNIPYSVVIPDDAKSWISVLSNTQTKSLAEDKVTLAFAQNTTYDDRESSVTIKQTNGPLAETIKIMQACGEGLFVDRSDYSVSYEAVTLSVGIKANVDYEITSEAEWIQYVDTKALTESQIILSIESNNATISRTGDVVFSQKGGPLSCRITIQQDPLPGVQTETAYNIEYYSAKLAGSLLMESASAHLQEVWFLYSDSASTVEELKSSGKKKTSYTTTSRPDHFSAIVNELDYNTQYYYVACAKISDTDYYGDVMCFTTNDITAEVTTYEPESIWYSRVKFSGYVSISNNDGTLQVADTWFLFSDEESDLEGLIANGEHIAPTQQYDSKSFCTLVNLNPSTEYYYVCCARVKDKSFYGNVESFTTKTVPEGAVDMGVNVCWAPCNIGASKPEEYGDYYAWGETETKSSYNEATYKYRGSALILEDENDVAHIKLGGNWRMPTYSDWIVLSQNSYYKTTTVNGVQVEILTSRSNGNQLIFPMGGMISGSDHVNVSTFGLFWTSTRKDYNSESAYIIRFPLRDDLSPYQPRYYGLMIRPVAE